MERTGALTKALATVGTVLAWCPIAATLILAAVGLFEARRFRFDYLMPAELFPLALAGGALLLWAAARARMQRKAIGWGIAAMLGLLVGGQALAVVTGLASGETEPAGWRWILVMAAIAGYTLALVEVGCAGALLMRDLFSEGKAEHRAMGGPRPTQGAGG